MSIEAITKESHLRLEFEEVSENRSIQKTYREENSLGQILENLSRIPEVASIWVSEWSESTKRFRVQSLVSKLDLVLPEIYDRGDSPCGKVLDENSIFESSIHSGSFNLFRKLTLPENCRYLGYPIVTSDGILIGVIGFLLYEKFKHKFKNIHIIDLLSHDIAELMEKKRNEDFLKQTLYTSEFLKNTLAELFRLNSSAYSDQKSVSRQFLESGIKMFDYSVGLVSIFYGNHVELTVSMGLKHYDSERLKFPLENSTFPILNSQDSALYSQNVSEGLGFQNVELFQRFGFKRFIEYPLRLKNRTIGVVGFYDERPSNQDLDDYFIKIFNLFGQSLANILEKQTLNMFEVYEYSLDQF